jgi:hypothetical protein
MKHDVTFEGYFLGLAAATPGNNGYVRSKREISGPPLARMLSVALAAGFLAGAALSSVGGLNLIESLAVGYGAMLAVLAIQAGIFGVLRSQFCPERRDAGSSVMAAT